jgi:hypothetical protein
MTTGKALNGKPYAGNPHVLDPAPFRLRAGGGLDRDESEPILDRVIESCRNLVLHGVS